MQVVAQMQVRKTPELSSLCHKCKNLYNLANWVIRTTLEKTSEEGQRFWWRWQDLHSLLIPEDAFKAIPSQVAIEVLKQLDQNWKSFFALIKKWKTSKEDLLGRPEIPHFLKKNGETLAQFNYGAFSVQKDGNITFGRNCIPAIAPPKPVAEMLAPLLVSSKKDARRGSLCLIRILPRHEYYIYEFVYEKPETQADVDPTRILGIDLGVDNLVTCITNDPSLRPFLIRGGIPKSVNQFYNKMRAKIQSEKDLQGYKFETKRMRRVAHNRNWRIKDYFHKTARIVIDYCITNHVGRIILGYNSGWKQEVELGKRNNQNFVQLPFLKLKEMIKYKAELVGIQFEETDEAHTSKCSAFDGESVEHHDEYLGKRLKRGLFRTAQGILVNADVNGAANIIRKVVPDAFAKGIGAIRLWPSSVTTEPRAKVMNADLGVTTK